MNKLKDYWKRWCLCYRENGLKYTVKKTFSRIKSKLSSKDSAKSEVKSVRQSADNSKTILNNDILNLSTNEVNVGFLLKGGLGDLVVAANFLFKFREKYGYENLRLDVFIHNSYGSAKVVFYPGTVINNLYKEEEYFIKRFRDYDLFIELSRYPDVKRRNDRKMAEMMPELLEYVYLCERFRAENKRYFSNPGITDGQAAMLSIIKGKKRIHQLDIYGFFGVREEYEYPIPVMEDDEEYLKDLGLYGRRYITLHRGVDTNQTKNSVKLWPEAYYDLLATMIKEKYPDIVLVQIGVSYDRCKTIKGIDVDLIEKTNLEQIKALLKHSLIHIDGEGGMIHMRHALKGGRSIVLFGPTSADFFGYSENINLVGNGCKTWCEWSVQDWQNSCMRGKRLAPCMASLIPETVMDAVDKILKEESDIYGK